MPELRIPLSTYRLQFNRSFTFEDARRVVPYLHSLGVSDCYCSSYLKAVPESLHGYDVVDPTQFNPEIGTEEDFDAFVQTLQSNGMGQILDVVANHMGIAKSANEWWMDVLENGPSSPYSTFFDVDWEPAKPELKDKVLLPILGDHYGSVLENQEIRLVYEEGEFFIRYFEQKLPLSPKSYAKVLTHRLDAFVEKREPDDRHIQELQSIITAVNYLPPRSDRDPQRVAERYREKQIIKKRLATLTGEDGSVRDFIESNIRRFNGTPGEPESFDLLDELLGDQAYRLAYWRVASDEINYRRFFDINELVAIRMEDPAVFEKVHELIFRLIDQGVLSGLRIDHVDGLYDPKDYLQKLQGWARQKRPNGRNSERPIYVVVEKILGRGETLPADWPVHGTTGYDFLNMVNGLFVDGSNSRAFEEVYARFVKSRISFDDLVYEKKKLIMEASMSSEIHLLGQQLNQLSERNRRSRDFTLNSLTQAIREIIACFPVYRTYVTGEEATDRDRAYIRLAVAKAKRRNPALGSIVFDFVRDLLLLKYAENISEEDRGEQRRFVMKFQQTTSPVMAKGVEDTAFYIFNRLVSLNEVGGDPTQFGLSPSLFHDRMRERRETFPHSLSATSTHDAKRGEDVRARINVLSEMPALWRSRLSRWHKLNKKRARLVEDQSVPDRNEEILLYQTLIGTWPFGPIDDEGYRRYRDRIQAYATKALKEAKVHTSWLDQSHAYEEAFREFIDAILDRTRPNPFLDDFIPFQEKISHYGIYNSLSQVLLKTAAPGVPDFYQGTELWDLNLVDPDNRGRIDFEERTRLLSDLERMVNEAGPDRTRLTENLLESRSDGRIKLYVTMSALRHRRERGSLFREGSYLPLEGKGEKKDHLFGFARGWRDQEIIAVIPLRVARLIPEPSVPPLGKKVWGETWIEIPRNDLSETSVSYRNLFTGERIKPMLIEGAAALSADGMFNSFPVALLEKVIA